MTDQEICTIIAQAQRAQLAKPARAVVNSETAFVSDRITDAGYPEIASKYWSWSCRREFAVGYNEEVRELQQQLIALSNRDVMPAWGTYGT